MTDTITQSVDTLIAPYAIGAAARARFTIEPGWRFGRESMVEWRDCDAFAHANHAAYLLWYESCRNLYLECLGLPRHSMDTPGPVMKSLTSEYVRPLSYHDPYLVTARMASMRRTSFVMEYATWGLDGLCNRSTQLFVLVVNRTGEKAAIPDALKQNIVALDDPVLE